MRIHSMFAVAWLTVGFLAPTAPAVAQQKGSIDSQIDEQISKKFDVAFDNGDAASLAALYTSDAVLVMPTGPIVGRDAIEKMFAGLFQQAHVSQHFNRDDPGSPHMIGSAGDTVWRTGQWGFTLQGKDGNPVAIRGFWSAINVREGDTWKIRMLTSNVTPPSPMNRAGSPSSSSQ
jgi:ketosteroid isomerase-like protein